MPGADLILAGAQVRTLDPARPAASAVAVHDGVITAVGGAEDVRDWRGPGTEVLDLHGAHLVPELADAHSHPVWGLDMATGTDLSGVTDLARLCAALAGAERIDGWGIGHGLDHNAFEGRPVHYDLVAEVLGGAPAFLRLYDGHSALANAAALAAAGVNGPRAFAQHAEVVCDASGRPTGHLVEHAAMGLVADVRPRLRRHTGAALVCAVARVRPLGSPSCPTCGDPWVRRRGAGRPPRDCARYGRLSRTAVRRRRAVASPG